MEPSRLCPSRWTGNPSPVPTEVSALGSSSCSCHTEETPPPHPAHTLASPTLGIPRHTHPANRCSPGQDIWKTSLRIQPLARCCEATAYATQQEEEVTRPFLSILRHRIHWSYNNQITVNNDSIEQCVAVMVSYGIWVVLSLLLTLQCRHYLHPGM